MTEPRPVPHEDPIAATQQFRRFVEEDLSAEVAEGRRSRNRTLLLVSAAIVLVVVVVVVILLVV